MKKNLVLTRASNGRRGDYIAYYQFDEREVPLFTMDLYGQGLYPYEYEFKYPKAGEPNSKVTIHIFDVKKEKDQKISLPEEYEYIPRIKWTPDDELVIFSMNRLQNQLNLWKSKAGKDKVELLYRETAPAYINIHDNLRFLKDGSFIWTSEMDGYNHIYHLSKDGEIINQVTEGQWEVTEFYGIDEDENTLYYQAAEESPLERAVYRYKTGWQRQKETIAEERLEFG
ncbi:MAG: DPP IV N-terminal domain-containing protein [Owenweeksia sp.]|nr:DPP IV N-terminal domain-containing protein [Owenweeksia sp.]